MDYIAVHQKPSKQGNTRGVNPEELRITKV